MEMTDKIHEIDKAQGVLETRVDGLEKSEGFLWKAVEEFRRDVKAIQSDMGRIKIDVAKISVVVGVVQVIATGVIVWALTKGKEDKHAAGQIHQTEEPYVVGGRGAPGSRYSD